MHASTKRWDRGLALADKNAICLAILRNLNLSAGCRESGQWAGLVLGSRLVSGDSGRITPHS
jgi:hypothetical protein